LVKRHRRLDEELVQGALLDDPGFLRGIVEGVLQHLLEAGITEHLGAAPYQRTESRKWHRNGYKPRRLKTRTGTLELLVPQDREGMFSTSLFARYQRNEKALTEMYLEGVSTRKVREVTE
jgi:putative transposase